MEMLKSNRGDVRKVFPVLFPQQAFLDINFQLPRVPCGRPDYEFHIDEHGFGEAPLIELKDGVVRSFRIDRSGMRENDTRDGNLK